MARVAEIGRTEKLSLECTPTEIRNSVRTSTLGFAMAGFVTDLDFAPTRQLIISFHIRNPPFHFAGKGSHDTTTWSIITLNPPKREQFSIHC